MLRFVHRQRRTKENKKPIHVRPERKHTTIVCHPPLWGNFRFKKFHRVHRLRCAEPMRVTTPSDTTLIYRYSILFSTDNVRSVNDRVCRRRTAQDQQDPTDMYTENGGKFIIFAC